MFDGAVRQGLQAVSSPEMSGRVIQDAQSRGPAAAISEAVMQAMVGIRQAAQSSGVTLPPEVLQAAAVAIAQVMVAMMVDAGLVEDPDAVQREVMTAFKGGAQ